MGVRCDGSVAGGNARSTFPYVHFCHWVPVRHFFYWFLSVASQEVVKRELTVPVTLGGHWPPGRQSAKVPGCSRQI